MRILVKKKRKKDLRGDWTMSIDNAPKNKFSDKTIFFFLIDDFHIRILVHRWTQQIYKL